MILLSVGAARVYGRPASAASTMSGVYIVGETKIPTDSGYVVILDEGGWMVRGEMAGRGKEREKYL